MFARIGAYLKAVHQNRRLADEFASMTERDLADIGISRADVPALLQENFDRLFAQALAERQLAPGFSQQKTA